MIKQAYEIVNIALHTNKKRLMMYDIYWTSCYSIWAFHIFKLEVLERNQDDVYAHVSIFPISRLFEMDIRIRSLGQE
jgi:hypothetical protein